jgi:hypothetical protein
MGWSGEQIRNAALIYQVGRQMGMSSRDIQIGLMAAMVESQLINVHYGDRDSLGLFQQRPSQGWGSPDQVLNPQYAAKKFFSALRGLGDRRNNMSMGSAAQAVQRSAYPGRYDQHIGDVRALWPRIANTAGDQQVSMDGGPYQTTVDQPQSKGPSGLKQTGYSVDQLARTDSLATQPNSMLDAWDGSTIQPLDTGNDTSGMLGSEPRTFISPGTNDAVIAPMAQTSGPFGKGVDGWRKAVVQTAHQYVGDALCLGRHQPERLRLLRFRAVRLREDRQAASSYLLPASELGPPHRTQGVAPRRSRRVGQLDPQQRR